MARAAAGEKEGVTESKIVRRLVVSSIAWLGVLRGGATKTSVQKKCSVCDIKY